MDILFAEQIATLLTEQNESTINWTAAKILMRKDSFVFLSNEDTVIACAEVERKSWYQWEISNVSINKNFCSEEKGWEILGIAEAKAIEGQARLLQCTIKSGNKVCERLFIGNGYLKTASFQINTSDVVNVLQKIV